MLNRSFKLIIGMGIALCLISGVFVFNAVAGPVTADDLIYLTEKYPPHNFEENGELKGISVEILELIWKKMGSKMTRKDVSLVPWARGYNQVLKEKNIVLFAMGYSDERVKVLQWVGPYYAHSLVFISKKSRGLKIGSLEDSKKYKIGVIREDIGQHILAKKGFNIKELDLSSSISSMLKKLDAGRIDMICYMDDIGFVQLAGEGYNTDDFETIFNVIEMKSGFGFNKDIPKELVQQFQKYLDELVKDGTVQKILDKYKK